MNIIKLFTICLFFAPLIFFGCSQKNESKISQIEKRQIRETKKEKYNSSNIIIVNFDNKITLKWDAAHNMLVKDTSYYEILKNKKKIEIISNSISNNEDLKVKVCSKEEANLKKGDVAFLYLLENQKIYLFSCLKLQFDVINKNCKYPVNLLNYIEKQRFKVQKQIKSCIE
ncbi:hypothetical protein C8J95_102380 [Elizabethkingia sp. YR214]|uniref:hypothetical protein n=1 Tax=Elizabethkingia sp. YR214 TaxID=2135667 RepID=UPI000D312D31|nr:hypothetical protein [Elizabethkingia sp. YR214]PUB34712.1 hypothetical protein C8J95_102380 [Elizabethkingia sp. YR214]